MSDRKVYQDLQFTNKELENTDKISKFVLESFQLFLQAELKKPFNKLTIRFLLEHEE